MEKIPGLEINEHQKSKRIIDIKIEDELLKKLIFPFNKFDITALEYKPFSRTQEHGTGSFFTKII
ncbi:carbon starvation induced protein CsiD [Candidatus Pelagibacter sp.]|nr:carbon starvation induced protein CsiD [Candidatus Pelagibacter sp.]